MYLEDSVPGKISQSQKDKYCMIPLMGGMQNSQTYRSGEENGVCQGQGWGCGGGKGSCC